MANLSNLFRRPVKWLLAPLPVGRTRLRLIWIIALFVELAITLAAVLFTFQREILEFVWQSLDRGSQWALAVAIHSLSLSDLVVLPVVLVAFVRAVPNLDEPPAPGRSGPSFQQEYLQFNLRTMLGATTALGVVFAIARATGISFTILLAGLIYTAGPWVALLAATSMRAWRPDLERRTAVIALGLLLALPLGVVLVASLRGIARLADIHTVSMITCLLWTPQVGLYLLLRPLLLPGVGDHEAPPARAG